MIKLVKAVELKPLDGYRLWVKFSDGSQGIRDYSDMIAEGGPMVEPLREKRVFDKVFLSMGIPTWPNGYEVDAIALHMELDEAGLLSTGLAA
jgi:Protein of unknown function (DUF2442)